MQRCLRPPEALRRPLGPRNTALPPAHRDLRHPAKGKAVSVELTAPTLAPARPGHSASAPFALDAAGWGHPNSACLQGPARGRARDLVRKQPLPQPPADAPAASQSALRAMPEFRLGRQANRASARLAAAAARGRPAGVARSWARAEGSAAGAARGCARGGRRTRGCALWLMGLHLACTYTAMYITALHHGLLKPLCQAHLCLHQV